MFRRTLNRKRLVEFVAKFRPCKAVMASCAGAHLLARKLIALGHEVKLISPQYVRPFGEGNKNNFFDAEAICEAASRPTMRFVPPKIEAQQTLSKLRRVRESLVHVRTTTAHPMHGFLREFGVSLPVGLAVIQTRKSALEAGSLLGTGRRDSHRGAGSLILIETPDRLAQATFTSPRDQPL